MSLFIEIQKKRVDSRKKYFDNYEFYSKKIGSYYKSKLNDVKVYIFGSILTGKWNHQSDIDILIVSENAPSGISAKAELDAPIMVELGGFNPFEIHLVTPEIFNGWYKGFIKDNIKEISID